MSETSMFFDSYPQDERKYSSAAFAKFMQLFYADGVVMNGGSCLQVRRREGELAVTVDPGKAIVRGYAYFNENEPLTLSVSRPSSTQSRIDRVVLRLDLQEKARSVSLKILEGEPGANPSPKPLTRNDITWDLSLAQLHVPANATMVTARRPDSTSAPPRTTSSGQRKFWICWQTRVTSRWRNTTARSTRM